MIVFDLRCAQGHVFEAWFKSSEAYEAQHAGGLLACPSCGSIEIGKAVMAPAVAAKGNQRVEPAKQPPPQQERPLAAGMTPESQAKLREMVTALAQAQAEALKSSQWVGEGFTNRARAMHYGDEPHAAIHGTASAEDAKAMMEEGVSVAPLLVPVAPPDQIN